ncbi:MAG TPA: SDR family oxidoreductase, partial [Propionibacteriaceae bacterium]|nr:SDR family oxidoreductase [Propionibacteriaceae bacterium]
AVTSVHEHQPRVGSGPYDAAKHGIGGLIKTFALELGQYQITANAVAPGEIATPMTGQEDQDPHQEERLGIPLGRPGDAREIAGSYRLPRQPASWLRHWGVMGSRRRHAADGPAGRLPSDQRRLAQAVAPR